MSLNWNLSTGADGAESITAIIDGEFFVAEKDHPNYSEIKEAVVARLTDPHQDVDLHLTDDQVRDLFDLSFKVGVRFDAVGSDRVKIAGGRVFFDGDEIHSALTDAIVRFHTQGVDDYRPLVKFFEKISTNPSTHSQQYLYNWLTDNAFTIADDGDIIAYKGVNNDFTSLHAGPAIVNGVSMNGNVPNNPGNVVEMPRSQVAHDPSQTCSVGLHAATFQFAENFGRGPVVKLKINPRDVVSVPVDAHGEKMRVCRYVVVEQVRAALPSVVDYGYEEYNDDEEEYDTLEEEITEGEVEAAQEEALEVISRLQQLKKRFGIGS